MLKQWHVTAVSLHCHCKNCTITVLWLYSTPTSKPQQQHWQHDTAPLKLSASSMPKSMPISKLTFTPIFSTQYSYTQISTPTSTNTFTNIQAKWIPGYVSAIQSQWRIGDVSVTQSWRRIGNYQWHIVSDTESMTQNQWRRISDAKSMTQSQWNIGSYQWITSYVSSDTESLTHRPRVSDAGSVTHWRLIVTHSQ